MEKKFHDRVPTDVAVRSLWFVMLDLSWWERPFCAANLMEIFTLMSPSVLQKVSSLLTKGWKKDVKCKILKWSQGTSPCQKLSFRCSSEFDVNQTRKRERAQFRVEVCSGVIGVNTGYCSHSHTDWCLVLQKVSCPSYLFNQNIILMPQLWLSALVVFVLCRCGLQLARREQTIQEATEDPRNQETSLGVGQVDCSCPGAEGGNISVFESKGMGQPEEMCKPPPYSPLPDY